MHKLPYPRIGQPPKDYRLTERLVIDQWVVPSGTTIKLQQTTNFGWVILPKDCPDVRGFTIPQRIFNY